MSDKKTNIKVNDLKISVEAKLKDIAMKLKDIRQEIIWRKNHEKILEDDFITYAELNGLEKEVIEGLSIIEQNVPQKITFKQIDELFNGSNIEKIKNNIVFTIDYDKTYENLMYDMAIPEPLVKGIMKNLEEHSKVKVKKVV